MISFSYNWRGGPIAFLMVGGFFILISFAILAFVVNEYSQLQRYQAGHCTITAKQVLQQEVTEIHTSNGHTSTTTEMLYRPDFQFTVRTADGQSYSAQGYDALNATNSDQASQQAIVDQFTVGDTYPCWYNPANPSQAVLTRQSPWSVFLLPSIFLFFLGVMLVISGVLKRRGKAIEWSWSWSRTWVIK